MNPRPHDLASHYGCAPFPRSPDATDSYIDPPNCPPGCLLRDHGRGLTVTRMSFLDLFVRKPR